MSEAADGYVFRPRTVAEVQETLALASECGRRVVLRGAGRSYGDASIGSECLVLDIGAMNQILAFDLDTGLMECEGGVTIEQLWRAGLDHGFWPPVVSGTMFPTLAGALGMNIHGKNAYLAGPIGDHVVEIDVVRADGTLETIRQGDEYFRRVVSSAGLLCAIVRVVIKMKRVGSGDLRVLPVSCAGWDQQFEAFASLEGSADYMVSWIDCFAGGRSAGRGQFHAGWHVSEDESRPASLRADNQDLPDTILGRIPKSRVWRFLKPLNNRLGMRWLNLAKHVAGRILGNGQPHGQSLVAFSFLLDYVPNWIWAYRPGCLIQYQCFVPKESARVVFARLVEMQQEELLETFLGVMKRHKPDRYMFSHGVDGYSLAMDFKVTKRNRARLWALAHRMNDLVLEAGGRFYLAKDSTLRPEDFSASVGEESIAEFREAKRRLDPEGLFTSALAERLGLVDRR